MLQANEKHEANETETPETTDDVVNEPVEGNVEPVDAEEETDTVGLPPEVVNDTNTMELPTTRQLQVPIGDIRCRELADALAKCCKELSDIEASRKYAMASIKEKTEAAKIEQTETAEIINRGTEGAEVDCTISYYYTAGVVVVCRNDTGEIVENREMRRDERQMEMHAEDDAQGDDPAAFFGFYASAAIKGDNAFSRALEAHASHACGLYAGAWVDASDAEACAVIDSMYAEFDAAATEEDIVRLAECDAELAQEIAGVVIKYRNKRDAETEMEENGDGEVVAEDVGGASTNGE